MRDGSDSRTTRGIADGDRSTLGITEEQTTFRPAIVRNRATHEPYKHKSYMSYMTLRGFAIVEENKTTLNIQSALTKSKIEIFFEEAA